MTLHSIIEYIKYWWNAKSRHKIHSPFVYGFTEHVLRNKGISRVAEYQFTGYHWLGKKNHRLLERLMKYFGYSSILVVPPEIDDESGHYDIVVLKNDVPRHWVRLFNKHLHLAHPGSIFLVHDIHKTNGHTLKWNRLKNHPRVKLSIDVYGAGLLFFNEDIKEKQAFIIRY